MSHNFRIDQLIPLQSRTIRGTRKIIREKTKAHEVIQLERKFHQTQTIEPPQIDTLQLAHEWGIQVHRAQTITEQITLTRKRNPQSPKPAPHKNKIHPPNKSENTQLKSRTFLLTTLIVLGLWIDLALLLKLF